MAPLPPNSTGRVWYTYVTGLVSTSREHTVMLRIGTEVTNDQADAVMLSILEGFGAGAFREGWRILRADIAAAGSTFSFPYQPAAELLDFVGTADIVVPYRASDEAIEDTCQGRSPVSGRRVDFSLYRAVGPIDTTFRYGMPLAVATALSVGSGSGVPICIDGEAPVWYTYVNQNYNSYWERRTRS